LNTSNISLPDWLTRCAENRPEHLAVQSDQVRWSFAELDRQATRLARQLATMGVQEGHRVALLAANGLPYVAFVHALTRLGAILVPLNLRLTLEELCWQVRDMHASLLVCDENNASLVTEIGLTVPELQLATLALVRLLPLYSLAVWVTFPPALSNVRSVLMATDRQAFAIGIKRTAMLHPQFAVMLA